MLCVRLSSCVAVLALTVLVITPLGCGSGGDGGGGNGGGNGGPMTVTLASMANQDGIFFAVAVGGPKVETNLAPVYGDNLVGDFGYGFWTFDLSSIPAGATIEEATLEVQQLTTLGNPMGVYGPVALGHYPALAATPNVTELMNPIEDPITDGSGVPRFVTVSMLPGLRTVDVRTQVRKDLSEGRTRSRFRLTDPGAAILPPNNFVDDRFVFEDAENNGGSGVTPVLRIRYTP